MKVYTYYKQDCQLQDFSPLVNLWVKEWIKAGFEPEVLINTPVSHPQYELVVNTIKNLPSVNPKGYTDANIIRWLAMDLVGGGLHLDSDVFPNHTKINSFKESLLNNPSFSGSLLNQRLTFFQKDIVPCAVWWKPHFDFKAIVKYAKSKPLLVNGCPHYSDQEFWRFYCLNNQHAFNVNRLCGTFKYEPNWKDYWMIHYPTNNLPSGNKADIIKSLI